MAPSSGGGSARPCRLSPAVHQGLVLQWPTGFPSSCKRRDSELCARPSTSAPLRNTKLMWFDLGRARLDFGQVEREVFIPVRDA